MSDIFEKQAVLNRKKRILQLRTNIDDVESYALEWLVLAEEYEEIGSLANNAFCLNHYYHYRHIVEQPETEAVELDPRPYTDV